MKGVELRGPILGTKRGTRRFSIPTHPPTHFLKWRLGKLEASLTCLFS
jgi:hypothetical protein